MKTKIRMKLCRKNQAIERTQPTIPQCFGIFFPVGTALSEGRLGEDGMVVFFLNHIGYFFSSELKSAFLYVSLDSSVVFSLSR